MFTLRIALQGRSISQRNASLPEHCVLPNEHASCHQLFFVIMACILHADLLYNPLQHERYSNSCHHQLPLFLFAALKTKLMLLLLFPWTDNYWATHLLTNVSPSNFLFLSFCVSPSAVLCSLLRGLGYHWSFFLPLPPPPFFFS